MAKTSVLSIQILVKQYLTLETKVIQAKGKKVSQLEKAINKKKLTLQN